MMRRLLSLVLLVTFGLPLWAPMLALGQSPESRLPACCRRGGKHHCAMSMTVTAAMSAAEARTPKWSAPRERCPYAPAAIKAAFRHPLSSAASSPKSFSGTFFARPLGLVQTESKRRMARDRSRQKRGPPESSFRHIA